MIKNGTRAMAWIDRIAEVRAIDGADAIEHYRVLGWWCVGKKNEFKVGDLVVYLSIDSWVPTELAPFLSKGKEPREYNGVKGERLKTVKLRGALSQGLLLPVETGIGGYPFIKSASGEHTVVHEGDDVSELLSIQKYEPPLPAQLRGKIAGVFPAWLRKTDQERIQNCFRTVEPLLSGLWVIEEKLDGSSMTVGYRKGDFILDKDGQPIPEETAVCSRNLSLKLDDDANSFVRVARETGVIDALRSYGRNLGISGELCGEGIQGNKYNLKGQRWFVFDILDVDRNEYVTYEERQLIINDLVALGAQLDQTPLIAAGVTLEGMTVDGLLQAAEAKSALNIQAEREGLVYKSVERPDVSFKAISNRWLLKTGE